MDCYRLPAGLPGTGYGATPYSNLEQSSPCSTNATTGGTVLGLWHRSVGDNLDRLVSFRVHQIAEWCQSDRLSFADLH